MAKTPEVFFDLVAPAKKPTVLNLREVSMSDKELYVRGDLYSEGLPLNGKNIGLWFRSPDGIERVVYRRYTSDTGKVEFILDLTDYALGRYWVWLEFKGDDEYEGCEEEPQETLLNRFMWG